MMEELQNKIEETTPREVITKIKEQLVKHGDDLGGNNSRAFQQLVTCLN